MRGAASLALLPLTLTLAACPGGDGAGVADPASGEAADPEAGGDGDAPPTRALRLGVAIPSYVHAVAWVGQDAGCFAAEGLDVDVEVMGGSAATMRALIAERIDVGLAGGDAALKANRAGADLVVVGGLVDGFYHRLIAREGVAGADDLRGKTVGLPFLGGPQDMAVRVALRELGLDPEADVDVVNMGKEFNRMAALSQGEIDATTSQAPPSLVAELGFRTLVDLPAGDARFPYMTVVCRRELLEEEPGVVRRLVGALGDAAAYYRDPAHAEACLAVLARELSGSDTEGARRERYETSGPALLAYPPRPSREGFALVQSFLDPPEGGAEAELDRLLALDLLDALVAAGRFPETGE